MSQYLLAVHGSEEPGYASDDDMQAAFVAVDALNAELQSSGVWVFAGGLQPPSTASVVRGGPDGVARTDGPYLESKEHIGGFWVIEVPDADIAFAWAAKATVACGQAVEVRPFQDMPEA